MVFLRDLRGVAVLLAIILIQAGCAVKPEPLTLKENLDRAREDKQLIRHEMKPVTGPLTLPEAIARALQYNFDNRMAMMETVLQDKQLTVANLEMLPKLAANAGYTSRSNELASESISYETRKISLEPSVSQESDRWAGDLKVSWSILDLGVSYFQAKQQADRYLQAVERQRHVVNNIVKDVIYFYWQAAAAEKMLPSVEETLENATAALNDIDLIREKGLQPQKVSLEQKKGILKIVVGLKRLLIQMKMARTRLAALVNLPMGSTYTLATPETNGRPPLLNASLAELENFGLLNRPDLGEQTYQERMHRNGVYKEIARLFPGLNLSYGVNYDSNQYYVHNWWNELALRASLNLMDLVNGPWRLDAAKTQIEVTKLKRTAMTIAAVTQINLGYIQYLHAINLFEDTSAITEIDEALSKVAAVESQAQTTSGLDRVNRATAAIASRLERENSLADAYKALSDIYFAIGYDINGSVPLDADHEVLVTAVQKGLQLILNGDIPAMPYVEKQQPEGMQFTRTIRLSSLTVIN